MKNSELKILGRTIAIAAVIYSLLGIRCPFKAIFNIPCPGCGMTRAIISALRLNFKMAFYYHPLFILVPFILWVLIFPDKFSRKFLIIFWITVICLLFIVYFIRMYIGINI